MTSITKTATSTTTTRINTHFFDRILSDLYEEFDATIAVCTDWDEENDYLFTTSVWLEHAPLYVRTKVPLLNDTAVLQAILLHQIRSTFLDELLNLAGPGEIYASTVYRIELEVRWSATDPQTMQIDKCVVSTRHTHYGERTIVERRDQ